MDEQIEKSRRIVEFDYSLLVSLLGAAIEAGDLKELRSIFVRAQAQLFAGVERRDQKEYFRVAAHNAALHLALAGDARVLNWLDRQFPRFPSRRRREGNRELPLQDIMNLPVIIDLKELAARVRS